MEDDDIASPLADELPVTATHRRLRPPAIFDKPSVSYELHPLAGDDGRGMSIRVSATSNVPYADIDRTRTIEHAMSACSHADHSWNGASATRRSGTCESTSMSTVFIAA